MLEIKSISNAERTMTYEGQHTGSISTKSEGQTSKGASLSADIILVGCVPFNDKEGQHSGRSLEQPIRGTS